MTNIIWNKSTKSSPSGDNCVEVGFDGDKIHVRSTRDRDGGSLTFDQGEWDAFIGGVADGEFRF